MGCSERKQEALSVKLVNSVEGSFLFSLNSIYTTPIERASRRNQYPERGIFIGENI